MRPSANLLASITVGWLFVGALISASKADVVYLGQHAKVAIIWYACPGENNLLSLKTLNRGRRQVTERFYKRHHCKILVPGDIGVVEDYRIWTEDTCLRLKPQAGCYWFPEQFVKKIK